MTIHIYSLGFIIIIEQTDSHVVSAFFPPGSLSGYFRGKVWDTEAQCLD